MEETQAIARLSALSNETRLRMLKSLVAAGPAGLLAGEVASAVGAAPSRASFHLSLLADTGLISATRNARQITYRVEFEAVGALMQYMLEDCCQNNPTVRACCMTGC